MYNRTYMFWVCKRNRCFCNIISHCKTVQDYLSSSDMSETLANLSLLALQASQLSSTVKYLERLTIWYKCLIVSLDFSHLGFWSGNLFLIAPFPDLCLLVPCNGGRLIHYIFNVSKNTISKHTDSFMIYCIF